MIDNYDDFCICSPEKYEILAKKYREQLNEKINQNGTNFFHLTTLLNENINQFANISTNNSNYLLSNLQKIYIKTYCLLDKIKKLNIGQQNYSNRDFNNNLYNKTENEKTKENKFMLNKSNQNNIYYIKKYSTNNLCQILIELINTQSQNKDLLINTISLITLWNEI